MLDDRHGTLVQLEVPFCISPSRGDLAVFAMEEVRAAFAVVVGYAPGLDAPDRQEACALVTFGGIRQVVYGYPNEEAYWKDPRGGGDVANGFHEVIGSLWKDNLDDYNRRTYGTRYLGGAPRHFFIGSKDASAQFLADEMSVEVFADVSYAAVRAEALDRLDNSGRDFRRRRG